LIDDAICAGRRHFSVPAAGLFGVPSSPQASRFRISRAGDLRNPDGLYDYAIGRAVKSAPLYHSEVDGKIEKVDRKKKEKGKRSREKKRDSKKKKSEARVHKS
jgi:hypothetical protein